ncbi:MAG: polysaccharide pyruvyl transferase family protein [Streptococcaceae bacterium]|nr:polysaccharide pyruvyl transferase family protein [Streptococcaceae bacterium]
MIKIKEALSWQYKSLVLSLVRVYHSCFKKTDRVAKFTEAVQESTRKKIILLDPPEHGNLGDSAIAYAEKLFLEKIAKQADCDVFMGALTDGFDLVAPLKVLLSPEDIVCLQGGGNFGNLYWREEMLRQYTSKKLPKNQKVMFPQSAYFTKDDYGENALKRSIRVYNKNNSWSLFARESSTKTFFEENYPNCFIGYTPDIVLSLDIVEELDHSIRKGAMTLFREDKEKAVSESALTEVTAYLETVFDRVTPSDTVINQAVLLNQQKDYLFKIWNEMASKELVITDRLHGMIFAYITETPCIVFGNSYPKISQTYQDWLKDCNFIKFISDVSVDNVAKAQKELEKLTPKRLDLEDKFEPLRQAILNKI